MRIRESEERNREREINRREFLRKGALAAAALPTLGAVISLTGCSGDGERKAGQRGGEDAGGNVTESGTSPSTPSGEASAPAPQGQPGEGDLRHVTEYPTNNAVLQALKFVEKSPRKDQRCENCQFYTAAKQPKMGKCQLIPQGLVKAEAWCASWQPRPA